MTADSTMQAHQVSAPAHSALDNMEFVDYSMDDDFAHYTTVNEHSSSTALATTVSPRDLTFSHETFSHDTFSHPPNSGTSTFLTTPSLLDDSSPYLNDSLDVSPLFNDSADFDDDAFFNYAPAKATQPIDSADASTSRAISGRSANDDDSRRRDLLRQRLSLTAGIAKSSRRQTKELEPIVIDTGDERSAKRQKNTLAARKSRQKKRDETTQLEAQIQELMDERDYWKLVAIQHGAPIPNSPPAASPSN